MENRQIDSQHTRTRINSESALSVREQQINDLHKLDALIFDHRSIGLATNDRRQTHKHPTIRQGVCVCLCVAVAVSLSTNNFLSVENYARQVALRSLWLLLPFFFFISTPHYTTNPQTIMWNPNSHRGIKTNENFHWNPSNCNAPMQRSCQNAEMPNECEIFVGRAAKMLFSPWLYFVFRFYGEWRQQCKWSRNLNFRFTSLKNWH